MVATTQHGPATEAAAQALSKQGHIEEMLDQYQQKHLSSNTRQTLGNIVFLGKIAVEQKVTFTYEFP